MSYTFHVVMHADPSAFARVAAVISETVRKVDAFTLHASGDAGTSHATVTVKDDDDSFEQMLSRLQTLQDVVRVEHEAGWIAAKINEMFM